MKAISINSTNLIKVLLTDLLIFALFYFIPALSHLTAIPLYFAEPMRIFLFASYFLSANKWNNYFIAVSLPLFSVFVSGHPVFLKGVLMSLELLSNIIILALLFRQFKWNLFVSLIVSIVVSKTIYYIGKSAFIHLGLLKMSLVSAPLSIQILATAGLSIFFFVVYLISNQKETA
jgi:hypothetical protein